MSTSTEVELFQPRQLTPAQATLATPDRADIDSWIFVASDVIKLAGYICETDFVPKAYRGNAHATAAAILAGRELGLPPMTALRHVHIVEGSASLSAEYKRARVLAAGHDFDIVELNTTRCVVSARRSGSGKPAVQFTFTIEDAKRAGIFKPRGAWETRPRRMLFARAGTEACDMMFADVTNGLPTTELLEAGATDDDALAGYNESAGQASPAAAAIEAPAKPRTAQRRTRQAEPANPTAPVTPASDARSAGQTSSAPADGDAPPLPEDSPPDPEPEVDKDAPGSVTKDQLTKLGAIFTSYGFKQAEREERLVASSQIVNRKLGSASELSLNEARALIDTLEACGSRNNLIALLAAGKDATGKPEDGESGE